MELLDRFIDRYRQIRKIDRYRYQILDGQDRQIYRQIQVDKQIYKRQIQIQIDRARATLKELWNCRFRLDKL